MKMIIWLFRKDKKMHVLSDIVIYILSLVSNNKDVLQCNVPWQYSKLK